MHRYPQHLLCTLGASLGLFACDQLQGMIDPSSSLPPPTQVRILIVAADLSGSARNDPKDRCLQLGAQVQETLKSEGEALHVQALGSGSVEPIPLTQWRVWKRTQGVLRKDKAAQTPEDFVASLVRECQSNVQGADSSAVHRLVERAAGDLKKRCEEVDSEESKCASKRLVIMSDLRERDRPSLRNLQREGQRWRKALKEYPSIGQLKLNLDGIEVSVCGVSDFDGQEPRNNGAVVEEIWRDLVFQGDIGPFASHCPSLDNAEATTAPNEAEPKPSEPQKPARKGQR